MPKSKTRKRPAPRPTRAGEPTPQDSLTAATLALVQASMQLVQELETRILLATRQGEPVEDLQAQHHSMRTASLGLLVAYSEMTGLPDPRSSEIAGQVMR